jgi:hypothetical protein
MKSCNDLYASCKAVLNSAFVPRQVRNPRWTLVIEDPAACNMTNTGKKAALKARFANTYCGNTGKPYF